MITIEELNAVYKTSFKIINLVLFGFTFISEKIKLDTNETKQKTNFKLFFSSNPLTKFIIRNQMREIGYESINNRAPLVTEIKRTVIVLANRGILIKKKYKIAGFCI